MPEPSASMVWNIFMSALASWDIGGIHGGFSSFKHDLENTNNARHTIQTKRALYCSSRVLYSRTPPVPLPRVNASILVGLVLVILRPAKELHFLQDGVRACE